MKTKPIKYRDGVIKKLIKEDVWNSLTGQTFAGNERKFPKPVTENYKISIVTTCKDRTCDLKRTYVENIEGNIGYENVEFVLINYCSTDDMDEWAERELMKYIDSGVLNYYSLIEEYPGQYRYFRLCHSKNVGFKAAQGDIVNNVDADHYTNGGFAERLNLIANQMNHRKYMFVKSRQVNRGRLGFFKEEFIDTLGGYNEDLIDYGFEDPDLILRATKLGFTSWRFSGDYFRQMEEHQRHFVDNYENRDWKYCQRRNTIVSLLGLMSGLYRANRKRPWGNAKLLKNFKEEMEIE